MKFYENIEAERERIQDRIRKFGWTSDHNLDWFADCITEKDAQPVFVEFDDSTGLLTHKYPNKWRIWSDSLSNQNVAADKINEFSEAVLGKNIEEVWCDNVSDKIRPSLLQNNNISVGEIYYSLLWPVLDMEKYNPLLSGRHFKEMRNAKSKFYREHKVEVFKTGDMSKDELHKIVESWKEKVILKQEEKDIVDLKYHLAIKNNFRGFTTSRVMVVDGQPVGFNAGYESPNHSGRFAGIIGIHDYSLSDLGVLLWLEDLEWIKNAGYKELDMQGSEDDGGLKLKIRFGAMIERKTDTFSISA